MHSFGVGLPRIQVWALYNAMLRSRLWLQLTSFRHFCRLPWSIQILGWAILFHALPRCCSNFGSANPAPLMLYWISHSFHRVSNHSMRGNFLRGQNVLVQLSLYGLIFSRFICVPRLGNSFSWQAGMIFPYCLKAKIFIALLIPIHPVWPTQKQPRAIPWYLKGKKEKDQSWKNSYGRLRPTRHCGGESILP